MSVNELVFATLGMQIKKENKSLAP